MLVSVSLVLGGRTATLEQGWNTIIRWCASNSIRHTMQAQRRCDLFKSAMLSNTDAGVFQWMTCKMWGTLQEGYGDVREAAAELMDMGYGKITVRLMWDVVVEK